jgi:predicted GTPase
VWDGGNNDLPFYRPQIHLVVVDPLRAGHELSYHPGEANFRRADVLVINKVDSASPEQLAQVRESIQNVNPKATVVEARSPVTVDDPEAIKGKRVLVIEDGPTLTHGEMQYGAGVVAAKQHGAAEIVDPRDYATGTLKPVYEKYDIGPVLPAMGYSAEQIDDMKAMVEAVPCDLVIIATPIDLRHLMQFDVPAVRVTYDLEEVEGSPTIAEVLRPVTGG